MDALSFSGVVRRFRVQDGTPLMAIETHDPAGCILIDPRWWLITVVDCRSALPGGIPDPLEDRSSLA